MSANAPAAGVHPIGVEVHDVVHHHPKDMFYVRIAIALAVQNILGDVFAALSIVLDKPFDVGDTIAVDVDHGVVD